MKKSFTIQVWYEDGMWYMDCNFLEICGEGITFYSALKDFVWNFKGFRKYYYYKNKTSDDWNENTLKMKKRYKMVMKKERE